ncbi:hypothetical protein NMG60_11018204 [Bertholletia excelsa]
MVESIIELINLATSNSLFIFCFCNLIIVFLLIAGSKPSSDFDQESFLPPPVVSHIHKSEIEEKITEFSSPDVEETVTEVSLDIKDALPGVNESLAEKTLVVEEEKMEEGEEESGSEEDDDELRRRAEEFIEKINRGWKDEKLRYTRRDYTVLE